MPDRNALSDSKQIDFSDTRTPCAIQSTLERNIRIAFTPAIREGKLCFRTQASLGGIQYAFELVFKAALPEHNQFRFSMNASWDSLPDSYHDYCRKTVGSWFALWTSEFNTSQATSGNLNEEHRYRQLCEEAIIAQQPLATIPLLQQAIINALKSGAVFITSHKEGGSRIDWQAPHFVRTDVGDYPNEERFATDAGFLVMLYCFYQSDLTRDSMQLPDVVVWRLILRQLSFPKAT